MCGIFGIVAVAGREPSLDDSAIERLRDRLTHRGPDDAGLWRRRNAVFAHRRLSVIDPSPAGRQPMETPDGRFVITYNGELYNDSEVRRELTLRGAPQGGFRSSCDTETVLHAFATWGTGAFARLRGMYALAIYDTQEHLLTLARDPLGVKPLYVWNDSKVVIFASEPGPILSHPLVSATPNMRMVSAYLTTIRSVLGNDTLFEGVHALGAGQMAQCHVGGSKPVIRFVDLWKSGPPAAATEIFEDAGSIVRDAVTDSVRSHMRSDVPICALLSGGLDSSAIASVAVQESDSLRTYCAGAASDDDVRDDLSCARLMAEHLGTRHGEAIVTGEHFRDRWPWMVQRLGTPLSTPNEVAIHAVASRLREDGCVVTISGEGADELFAGYDEPMAAALHYERQRRTGEIEMGPGRFQLESNAWIPPAVKPALFESNVWNALADDRWLTGWYEQAFEAGAQEVGPAADPLEAHLRFHRRVNLSGLLQRLDTATMLASVEGRTPFADAQVAALAESLPMRVKYAGEDPDFGAGGAAVATHVGGRTKIALRSAFTGALPEEILQRKKASFPLPFQQWIADCGPWLKRSRFARTIFTEAAVEAVAQNPSEHWRLAWPMVNVAMWGDAWW